MNKILLLYNILQYNILQYNILQYMNNILQYMKDLLILSGEVFLEICTNGSLI